LNRAACDAGAHEKFEFALHCAAAKRCRLDQLFLQPPLVGVGIEQRKQGLAGFTEQGWKRLRGKNRTTHNG